MVHAVNTVIGKTITAKSGTKATCKSCRTELVCDGTERVVAHEVKRFDGKGFVWTGTVGWKLNCLRCRRPVEFESHVFIKDWR